MKTVKFWGAVGAAGLALAAFGGDWELKSRQETSSGEKLRGFGKCDVAYETWEDDDDEVKVMNFACQSAENAETVIGKFLWDLLAGDKVSAKDGVFSAPGGSAFAVGRKGTLAAIYAAEKRSILEDYFKAKPELKATIAETAKCPEWMKRFAWGTYGMGGLENFHEWMKRAGAKKGEQLDPREDYDFLKQMGHMHFDNWVQLEKMDNSDGITVANGIYWKAKYAEENGIPYSYRTYMPADGWEWSNRRFAQYMEKPAEFIINGWLRYGEAYLPHTSWFEPDIWGYFGQKTIEQMKKFKTDKVQGWMHPAGELVHQPWYDQHGDYSPAAKADWHKYLQQNGVTLDEASEMYSRGKDKFVSWDQVGVPEFATFAGLPGMVLDLAGTWFSSSNRTDWTAIKMPGNKDYMDYYKNANGGWADRNRERYMKRTFSWDKELAGGEKVYLYFFPMSSVNVRNEVTLNGKHIASAGTWCALDVTEELKHGANEVEFLLRSHYWNGRVFLSTQEPAVYPNLGEARNKMFALWNDWRRDAKRRACEIVFDAMRQADPDSSIKFMAPIRFGTPITNKLMYEWGGFAHFTGEGIWYFPWYKRYGKLWGYQGTSELSGPAFTVRQSRNGLLRTFLAGLNLHEPVFLTQTYSRNPDVRAWWLERKELLKRMGKYDIYGPQVLLYRRSIVSEDMFPAPEPLVGVKGHRVNTPWDWDLGRGSLQSIGQSMLYIDDDGIDAGKMYSYKLMVDSGNEVMDAKRLEKIAEWVKAGGTFVAFPFTGRSTVTEGDSWPIAKLAGAKAEKLRALGGKVTWLGNEYADNGSTINDQKNNLNDYSVELAPATPETSVWATYENGKAAITVRKLGLGKVVWLGSAFWRNSQDKMGIWWPKENERAFLKKLFAELGFDRALCETDDSLVWAQPYRSNSGTDFVACLCNFNEEGTQNVGVTLRTGRKPSRVVAYGAGGITYPEFEYEDGECKVKVGIGAQDVKVVYACDVYEAGDAASYWWKENQIAWHQLKATTRDFSKYTKGKWRDPTQDLKTGWKLEDGRECVADVLQFWGVKEGKGAKITKRFDLENTDWLKGGVVRFICGAWAGPNFMTKGRIWLNGTEITDGAREWGYIEKDVTKLVKATGNEIAMEFADATDGKKFTGVNGTIHLYHRAHAEKSMAIEGGFPAKFFAPKEWEGKYRVFVYMEDETCKVKPPLGVKIEDRVARKHHHNFGWITDVDVTGILKFGEENEIKPLGDPRTKWDWNKIKVRIDLFKAE